MNNKRSSIIGFALIGIILLLFSWYNTKQYEKQVEAKRSYYDSLAVANPDYEAGAAEVASQSVVTTPEAEDPIYQRASLQAAASEEASFCTLENEKLSVTLSSKGATNSSPP